MRDCQRPRAWARPGVAFLVAMGPCLTLGCARAPAAASARAHTLVKNGASMIVQAGNPVLRGRAQEVPAERIPSPEFQALVSQMIETMREAPGVGLAAPQIGIPLRVIVLEDRASSMQKLTPLEIAERGRTVFGPRVFVNPVLMPLGEEKATFFEGCLSVEGYTALVARSTEIEVRGLDEHGAPQTWRVKGWPARILQHEVDHLDGTLYVDRMLTRSFMNGAEAKARYAGRSIASILADLGL